MHNFMSSGVVSVLHSRAYEWTLYSLGLLVYAVRAESIFSDI